MNLQLQKSEDNQEYGATKEVDECVSWQQDLINQYYAEMNRTGRINLYRNSYFKYYQGFIMKGSLYHSGQEGELLNTYVNHYRNLITHAVNMVCQQKLSYEPQATVGDSQAQDQVRLAKGILYLYANRSDTDLDGKLRTATEMSCVFMESYVSCLWNKNLGRTIAGDFDEDSQQQISIKEGDNEYNVHSPFDVIMDVTTPAEELCQWKTLRRWENKFEIAARYPNWSKEITCLSTGASMRDSRLTYSISDSSDIIPVYYFFHKKTAAVPAGRMTVFIDDHIILSDGDLPYREIPLYRMNSADLWGSPFGYSRCADVLPLQESVDRLTSAILTNQLTFATQNILIAKGSSISWQELYGGLNVIEFDASLGEYGVPKALQLTSSPPETFKFIDWQITNMGTIMGINDAIKGNPDLVIKGQASGTALAIMNTNAIQFNSDLQKGYVRLAEQIGTATIHNLQDFAFPDGMKLSRQGVTVSATNKYLKKSYDKTGIDKIDRIIVRYGNPYAQTTSGRIQMAQELLTANKITTDQYFEVIETGDLEAVFQSEESEINRIKENCEDLQNGQVPPVGPYDNFPTFIKEACAVLNSRDSRDNPKIVDAVQKYVSMAIAKWKNLSQVQPEVAALLNIPVLGAPPPPPPQGQLPPPQGKPPMPPQNGAAPKPPMPQMAGAGA